MVCSWLYPSAAMACHSSSHGWTMFITIVCPEFCFERPYNKLHHSMTCRPIHETALLYCPCLETFCKFSFIHKMASLSGGRELKFRPQYQLPWLWFFMVFLRPSINIWDLLDPSTPVCFHITFTFTNHPLVSFETVILEAGGCANFCCSSPAQSRFRIPPGSMAICSFRDI